MLPNHSPLVIAEQFGTLEAMYPGRIDLGLGRAPGSDQNTTYALRRDPARADLLPAGRLELQAYLAGESRVPGVDAVPGKGSRVPLYILGSSLFGARVAAALGLPYAFARHFAPQALEAAVATYRREFRPSEQLDAPVRDRRGQRHRGRHCRPRRRITWQAVRRTVAVALFGRGQSFTDERSRPARGGRAPASTSTRCSPTPPSAPRMRSPTTSMGFRTVADADELITAHQARSPEGRLRSVTLTAEAMESAAA